MSQPIKICNVARAAKGDIVVINQLRRALAYNIKCHSMSVLPCKCKKPCTITTNEALALVKVVPQASIFFKFK